MAYRGCREKLEPRWEESVRNETAAPLRAHTQFRAEEERRKLPGALTPELEFFIRLPA